ncbi:MAG: hypothetical protein WCE64_12580 [Bacteroidales bacterium]
MKTSAKILQWAPRILCILAILFLSLFALDSFSSELTFWQNAGAFLMHLVPSFVLLVILIVAWKWENIGGIILIIVGLALCVFLFNLNYNQRHFSLWQSIRNVTMFCLPLILAGILFVINHSVQKSEGIIILPTSMRRNAEKSTLK